jgi:hypothetical protein
MRALWPAEGQEARQTTAPYQRGQNFLNGTVGTLLGAA